MLKTSDSRTAQAATELAVFGAILIFILGTIVRSAVGNGYQQDQNFKAMRMAMLGSWQGSLAATTSRNTATTLVVEDRLAPDSSKYGDLDRNAYIATGSGTFTFEILYPIDQGEASSKPDLFLPAMDMYINGQHFPFSIASYVSNRTICQPGVGWCPSCQGINGSSTTAQSPAQAQSACITACGTSITCAQQCQQVFQQQCQLNQCLRNQREWLTQLLTENSFNTTTVAPINTTSSTAAQRQAQMASNACSIFNALGQAGVISIQGGGTACNLSAQASLNHYLTSGLPNCTTPSGMSGSCQWENFEAAYQTLFPSVSTSMISTYLSAIESILQSFSTRYKLFYTIAANGTSEYNTMPPATCTVSSNTSCMDQALGAGLSVPDASGAQFVNTNGDMQYDLLRLGDYAAVESQFPPVDSCLNSNEAQYMRCNIAWQWQASPAVNAGTIGLDPNSDTYPQYDIDGRLKMVNIYAITQNTDGTPTVSYEDFQGGDIDQTWDTNSCTPKPGLQNNSELFTFTKDGTYLRIQEGKLFNPETGTVVRSVNQRDTIDLIQRSVQLSNNTGRFCSSQQQRLCCVGDPSQGYCSSFQTIPQSRCPANEYPNPVEVCAGQGAVDNNCFASDTIAATCYDTILNTIFVRSRLEDRRGNWWMTNASGQLKVH